MLLSYQTQKKKNKFLKKKKKKLLSSTCFNTPGDEPNTCSKTAADRKSPFSRCINLNAQQSKINF